MTRRIFFCMALLLGLMTELASAENNAPPPTNSAISPLKYPDDLRRFRSHALKADGLFAPDIAFAVRFCTNPACKKPYVFGSFPRLSRAPFDDLAAVHKVVEAAAQRQAPKTMYSAEQGKSIPRACPYCGTPELDARADRMLFCHVIPESGEDLQIEYTLSGGHLAGRKYFRVSKDGAAAEVNLLDESETSFERAFGQHFSLRAVWNEIFAKHSESEEVVYKQVAPGLFFLFRPEKISDEEFRVFADTRLKPDRTGGKFTRLESLLKLDAQGPPDSYLQWAGDFAERLKTGRAECFVGVSFPELRSAATTVIASRNARLNLLPGNPSQPGQGKVERGELSIATQLGGIVRRAVISGLSLHQACSLMLAEGVYTLDAAERIAAAMEANLHNCTLEFADGRTLILRDPDKQERKIDLLTLAGKLDTADPVTFSQFRDRVLRWDPQRQRFGTAPLEREVSPIGMPAYIERRIRPAEFCITHNLPHALFEPLKDAERKRCDICYTCECVATLQYLDPTKSAFKDIPNVNAARPIYYQEGGVLPMEIEASDSLMFPGRLPGILECKVVIFTGKDIASLASENSRAAQLALFGGVAQATNALSFYAFTTNCAALAPRPLTAEELELVKSRAQGLVKEGKSEPGLELNLHFDLPWEAAKGTLRSRK